MRRSAKRLTLLWAAALTLTACPAGKNKQPAAKTAEEQVPAPAPAPAPRPDPGPAPPAVKTTNPAMVLVLAGAVRFFGRPVAKESELLVDNSTKWKIPALFSALQGHTPGPANKGKLLICGGARTDFKVIKKVIYTGGVAGYPRVSLGQLQKQTAPAVITPCKYVVLRPAPYENAPRKVVSPAKRLRLVLLMGSDGYNFLAGGRKLRIPQKGGAFDNAGLSAAMTTMRKKLPDKEDLTVAVEDGVVLGDLMVSLGMAQKAGFKYLKLADAGVAL